MLLHRTLHTAIDHSLQPTPDITLMQLRRHVPFKLRHAHATACWFTIRAHCTFRFSSTLVPANSYWGRCHLSSITTWRPCTMKLHCLYWNNKPTT